LWILPAWPIASLSIDRITRGLDLGLKSLLWHRPPLRTPSLRAAVPEAQRVGGQVCGAAPWCQTFARQSNQSREMSPWRHGAALDSVIKIFYCLTFLSFLCLMLVFVAPTFDKSFTWFSLGLCVLLILTPTDYRFALLTFAAGSALGYYLELWGTTRECWTYYTNQTPPLFAVLAHGMAAVAFWRAGLMLKTARKRFGFSKNLQVLAEKELGQESVKK
jgi:hypothetical protein